MLLSRSRKSPKKTAAPPLLVALAGPNGAGKSLFFQVHLQKSGLRFVNADALARELQIGPYEAAKIAGVLRNELVKQRESFLFETVFSDPVGDKIDFLQNAVNSGYRVILCYIGLENAALSDERVAMRVSQGGHDVPVEKLLARFPRTLANLERAIRVLPEVWIFDNSNLARPFRKIALYKNGRPTFDEETLPDWLAGIPLAS